MTKQTLTEIVGEDTSPKAIVEFFKQTLCADLGLNSKRLPPTFLDVENVMDTTNLQLSDALQYMASVYGFLTDDAAPMVMVRPPERGNVVVTEKQVVKFFTDYYPKLQNKISKLQNYG